MGMESTVFPFFGSCRLSFFPKKGEKDAEPSKSTREPYKGTARVIFGGRKRELTEN